MTSKSRSESGLSKPGSQEKPKESSRSGVFLKAVGAVAAVVSLLLGLNQVTGLVQTLRIHHKEFSETMKSGEQEIQRRDYAAAFRSFKHATELDPIDREAQTQETQAAMRWLENVHAQNQTFTDVSNQLLPVLDNSLSRAKGADAGDILSHIAWANFLKYRDGLREGIDIDENLRLALATDPNNPYAHAVSGFWILWQGGKVEDARPQFSAALASGRVRQYVRSLQVAALINRGSPEMDAEQLRVANEMRKGGESMSAEDKRRIFWNNFSSKLHARNEMVAGLSVLPPDETVATYDWLDGQDAVNNDSSRQFVLANLKEISGDRTGALLQYKSLQRQLKSTNSSLVELVNAAIKRLSGPN